MLPSNQGNIKYAILWIPLILGAKVLHLVYETWAWVVCLICTPWSPRATGLRIYISGRPRLPMLHILCNPFTHIYIVVIYCHLQVTTFYLVQFYEIWKNWPNKNKYNSGLCACICKHLLAYHRNTYHSIATINFVYCTAQIFDGGKYWRIWRISSNSSIFFLSKFSI